MDIQRAPLLRLPELTADALAASPYGHLHWRNRPVAVLFVSRIIYNFIAASTPTRAAPSAIMHRYVQSHEQQAVAHVAAFGIIIRECPWQSYSCQLCTLDGIEGCGCVCVAHPWRWLVCHAMRSFG